METTVLLGRWAITIGDYKSGWKQAHRHEGRSNNVVHYNKS